MIRSSGLAAGALLLALAAPAMADYPNMSLRMAHPLPETWPAAEWDKWWAEEVERRSDGAIRIEVFWAGQIGGLTEIKSLVSAGAVDLGVFAQAVHAEELPLASVSAGLLNRVSADPRTAHDLAGNMFATDVIREDLGRHNLHVLKWTVPSTYTLQCNRPVTEMADLRGLRVRAVGGAYVPIWMESFGIVPTRVQAPEIREGLTRGTLDCNFGPIEWATFSGFETAAPYWSDINTGSFTTFQLYVNRAQWESWPENVRDLMTEVAVEAMERDQDALPEVAAAAVEAYEAAGGQLVELADMEALAAASPDMIAIWADRMAGAHPDAVEALVPLMRAAAESFAE
ncbi:MAG: TRAP transporter substrate-binding protein DctP [Alkalilacustris sp.]